MAPDKYWNNLDWLTYLYTESPMAAKVVSCNSMGVVLQRRSERQARRDAAAADQVLGARRRAERRRPHHRRLSHRPLL